MKKVIAIAALALACATAFAQPEKHFKVYGFIRNYFAFDTRENVALTEDFFTYLPKDRNLNTAGEDLNANPNFKFAALTSRLGIDVLGYEYKDWKFNAKIEADFYNGLGATANDPVTKSSLTGTAVLRMRQAFVSLSNGTWTFKAGQAWHPMAADMPDVFSLNTGAPFGPFSRTPLVSLDYGFGGGLSFTLAGIWQMQYTSTGPYGASANYVRNGGGEVFAGLNYKKDGFLGRAGLDVLAISPRTVNSAGLKVNEKLFTYTDNGRAPEDTALRVPVYIERRDHAVQQIADGPSGRVDCKVRRLEIRQLEIKIEKALDLLYDPLDRIPCRFDRCYHRILYIAEEPFHAFLQRLECADDVFLQLAGLLFDLVPILIKQDADRDGRRDGRDHQTDRPRQDRKSAPEHRQDLDDRPDPGRQLADPGRQLADDDQHRTYGRSDPREDQDHLLCLW